jgi:hypothetical protein
LNVVVDVVFVRVADSCEDCKRSAMAESERKER